MTIVELTEKEHLVSVNELITQEKLTKTVEYEHCCMRGKHCYTQNFLSLLTIQGKQNVIKERMEKMLTKHRNRNRKPKWGIL